MRTLRPNYARTFATVLDSSPLRPFLIGTRRALEPIEFGARVQPVGALGHVGRWCRHDRPAGRVGRMEFPPALTAVVVFVIDHETGLAHHRPDPTHAMIAVVAVLVETVPQEKTLGRAKIGRAHV